MTALDIMNDDHLNLSLSLSIGNNNPPKALPGIINDDHLNLSLSLSIGNNPVPKALPGIVHSYSYLKFKQIKTIQGEVQCKHCEKIFQVEFDLKNNFEIVEKFIARNKANMYGRAAEEWMKPVLPNCEFCQTENCAKPVKTKEISEINWLFLLLGQMLGCCTLKELKYLCKHYRKHRSGAKDRVLYISYLTLCNQFQPRQLFSS
ncbi:uncharacterized protein LOC124910780 [Impatiens glandulifera]|uniref:uncharacterized protein LOC124910780 n=1 Tax=Impatiens glandulifera TaxID=253017 RepID=UPI001FB055C4|nr:uncharacterized protein LOC124910780 [Impatiens glandulifera]